MYKRDTMRRWTRFLGIDTIANHNFTLKATQPATIALVAVNSAHIKFKLTLITICSLVLKY